nr:immunoglobulin heavy chain junction region [Mus musculus]MBK4189841.1 immunoglobulin heavy chain junction region [Mus musculus]
CARPGLGDFDYW